VAQDFEKRLLHEMRYVLLAAGKVIVDAQHVIVCCEQLFAQVRSKKPAPPVTRIFFISRCYCRVEPAQ
jgi:hypothetical protein